MIRSTRLTALVLSAALSAGCGLSAGPSSNARTGQIDASARALTDDSDLSGGQQRSGLTTAALANEAIARQRDTLVFPTRLVSPTTGRGARPAAGGLVVTGALRYPDFAGQQIPAANVTVRLSASAKEVGTALTDAEGRWTATLPQDLAGKAVTTQYELGNQYWTLGKYRWAGPSIERLQAVNDTGERALEPQSENGQAALIHQIWNRALTAFKREDIPLDWWSKRITTNWPASGDYYSFGSVNLTDAKQWDVNGHEIGHSLFFAGFNSASGGGQHKIDECYGADLAWSEGFASFFSGVISLRRDDPDARFEYMVPRRKPIRLENVPADVCEGHTNEWRVSAALWDLYDTNADGTDQAALEFKTIWGALVKTTNSGRINDVRDAYQRIAAAVPADQRPGLAKAFAQSGVPVGQRLAAQ